MSQSYSLPAPSRVLLLRVDPGDDVLRAVQDMIAREHINTAVVASGIGTLRDCHLHMVETTGFPVAEAHPRWSDEPLEMSLPDTRVGAPTA